MLGCQHGCQQSISQSSSWISILTRVSAYWGADLRTIAKQRHAAALFKMLALSERYEAARTLEAELLVEASAAREVDRICAQYSVLPILNSSIAASSR